MSDAAPRLVWIPASLPLKRAVSDPPIAAAPSPEPLSVPHRLCAAVEAAAATCASI